MVENYTVEKWVTVPNILTKLHLYFWRNRDGKMTFGRQSVFRQNVWVPTFSDILNNSLGLKQGYSVLMSGRKQTSIYKDNDVSEFHFMRIMEYIHSSRGNRIHEWCWMMLFFISRNFEDILGKLSICQTVSSAKCLFGKTSVRQNIRSAKCLLAKCLSEECSATLNMTKHSCHQCGSRYKLTHSIFCISNSILKSLY
jgi:hypothetical protein